MQVETVNKEPNTKIQNKLRILIKEGIWPDNIILDNIMSTITMLQTLPELLEDIKITKTHHP